MTRLFATALTLMAFATFGPPATARQREAALDVAPMPDHWVPFSATFEIVNPTNRWGAGSIAERTALSAARQGDLLERRNPS